MPELVERLQQALAERYRIERELGRGGFATVFLATDVKHQRPVALKVLHPELALALGSARFLREIAMVAQFRHPHILPLYDSGAADGLLYYVMPFVEGESLRARLEREEQLPLEDALRITREVADALDYAHGLGVVHRDVKPENILFEAGHAVVADFGIARAVSSAGTAKLTETGFAVGTPAYMSPEQAAGDPALDGRSDSYSLGCVLYEMLGGAPPFTGPSPQAVLAAQIADPVPQLRSLRPTVPAGVERALERALAKEAGQRYATAEEFVQHLMRASTAEAVAAEGRRERTRRRWRAVRIAAGAVLVAAAGWWTVRAIARAGGPRIRSLAVLPLQNLSGDTAQDYFVLGIYDGLIGELDQIAALRVISRTSAQSVYQAHKSVPEIARALNVDAVVEGSVLHAGDSVRLRVQLIRALPTEQNIWGQTYIRNTRDVLGLNSDVARSVARQVQASLSSAEATRLATTRRVNPKTYEAYLRGMYLLEKAKPEDNARGLAYLKQAVEDDPADPLAYAGLADAYITTAHGPAPQLDALPLAQEAAQRALRLDSTLAETMAALGFLKGYWFWDWEASDSLFRRAIELNPSSVWGHYWYAWQLHLFGQDDSAIAEHKRAEEADPLNAYVVAWTGELFIAKGRFEEAMAQAERALALNPNMGVARLVAAQVSLARGRNEDAVAEARKAVEADSSWLWVLGYISALAGRPDEARRVAAILERQPADPYNAFSLASVYASLGDKDRAFRWLDYPHPHAWVPWVRVEPWFSKLWGDPRFPALLERFHLPPRS
jgi:eukaryotic-like serine/threonine-protein kinase